MPDLDEGEFVTDSTTTQQVGATVLGYPRQGRDRELKKAIEAYWAGRTDAEALTEAIAGVRAQRLTALAGLTEIPVGDFSLYDLVLDTADLFGAIPARFADLPAGTPTERLDRYFAMARGTAELAPLEMTKWFDTNYHYIVPELDGDTTWSLHPELLLAQIEEARSTGATVRPVLVGPVTFLLLAKAADTAAEDFAPLSLLDTLLPQYVDLLAQLAAAGIEWVQLDEPVLVTDLDADGRSALEQAYAALTASGDRPKLLVASYFGDLGANADLAAALPVEGHALDLVGAGAKTLTQFSDPGALAGKRVLAGVVEGRNVWRTDLAAAVDTVSRVRGLAGQVDVSTSCSLLHVPIDVSRETEIDPEVRSWLAFADQKIDEVVAIAAGIVDPESVRAEVEAASTALRSRAVSPLTSDPAVRDRVAAVTEAELARDSAYPQRAATQAEALKLPALPTTTIGSFPQTGEIRKARAAFTAGTLDAAGYQQAMRDEVARVIRLQEELGVDVLVHGEPERNDMVQYFAPQLRGVVSTRHGWVQSYGTRCVRPPIIAGDIARPEPMTVEWSTYAQSLTEKPVKGMLTGPVTMLAWSFVRDDQPVGDTAFQMALALRDEVVDLEQAGISVIQVDEPALRETLPLRAADRPAYLRWAVDAFRLTTAGVGDATQVHTHMCYAEFGDITEAIIEMDADVISLEAARSRMEIIGDLEQAGYPREVGPGVWDIHSPRVPSTEEIVEHLHAALAHLPAERLWVNPDCGLKTRGYAEVNASLENLVTAAGQVRAELG